jgi:hypothetical protein
MTIRRGRFGLGVDWRGRRLAVQHTGAFQHIRSIRTLMKMEPEPVALNLDAKKEM